MIGAVFYDQQALRCLPEQGFTVPAGAGFDARPLEQGSTGMIGAELDDSFVGTRLDN